MSYRRAKERSFSNTCARRDRRAAEAAFFAGATTGNCPVSRCGYTKGPRTVLIPAASARAAAAGLWCRNDQRRERRELSACA